MLFTEFVRYGTTICSSFEKGAPKIAQHNLYYFMFPINSDIDVDAKRKQLKNLLISYMLMINEIYVCMYFIKIYGERLSVL